MRKVFEDVNEATKLYAWEGVQRKDNNTVIDRVRAETQLYILPPAEVKRWYDAAVPVFNEYAATVGPLGRQALDIVAKYKAK